MPLHSHRVERERRVLLIALGIGGALTGVEIAGGYVSGSMSLLGDAVHLFADVAGYAVGILGLTLCMRPASPRMSYGYDRAESLGALISLMVIWVVSGLLARGALGRYKYPVAVHSVPMLFVAVVGVFGNILYSI